MSKIILSAFADEYATAFEEQLQGAQIRESRVAIDGHIITAAGMGAALEFGLALVEQFCGRETADALRHAVIAD